MPTLLQINITANWGSHGKIAEGIGDIAMSQGWNSYIAYGRWKNHSSSILFRIGCHLDEAIHLASSRLFDNHGLMSHIATHKLNDFIDNIKPDIIHLHNIHGYYLNYPILFKHLSKLDIPVVWTLHDCWSYTGHCAHYMYEGCDKWRTHCQKCPLKKEYPKSIGFDRSSQNFDKKKKYFLSLPNLTLAPVSRWLENDLRESFFKNTAIKQIYNGIDTNVFNIKDSYQNIRQKYNIPSQNKIVLGVASNWYHKGLEQFIQLKKILNENYTLFLVGLNKHELKKIPQSIIGIERTQDVDELTDIYSAADVFFNPTWEDNFPTTILESLACGTPVVTFDTGGCSESINKNTGVVIKKGDLKTAKKAIEKICGEKHKFKPINCREHILINFDKKSKFQEYMNLYYDLLKQ